MNVKEWEESVSGKYEMKDKDERMKEVNIERMKTGMKEMQNGMRRMKEMKMNDKNGRKIERMNERNKRYWTLVKEILKE